MNPAETHPIPTRWRVLEAIPGLVALAPVWHAAWGPDFSAFQALRLQQTTWFVKSVHCPSNCGCLHSVILRHDQTGAVGICRCDPPVCPDIILTLPDITPLEVNIPRLGRALTTAFGLAPRTDNFSLPHTAQFGAWSAQATPTILTLQTDRQVFRRVVAELTAQLRQPFALFAATSNHLDAHSQALLANHGAHFFPIDSTVALNPDGSLKPLLPPPEIFAPFSPKPPSPAAPPAPPQPRYAIRKDCGVWRIIFDGHEFYIKHERGMLYVAYLLTHPNESFHALDLMARIPEIYRRQLGLPEITDPVTGNQVTLESHSRLQERSLALDDRQAMRALFRRQQELEAILDDDSQSEPIKAEALRELEEIAQFQKHHGERNKDAAQRSVSAVRQSIKRLHLRLATASDIHGASSPLLRAFADHLQKHLLAPSLHHTRGETHSTPGLAGSFAYQPPPATHWLRG